jgi:potassium-transporting ATPase KdpC subunit
MRKTLISSVIAIVLMTLVLGLAYPLVVTGIGQVAFPGQAGGSLIRQDGKVVGSSLLAQRYAGAKWFHARPSQTGYDPSATGFSNNGPNQKSTKAFFDEQIAHYLAVEGPDNPGLTKADIPIDAVTTSGSGVDPHISEANAAIQAKRVARVRGLSLARVQRLIKDHTDGRFLGFVGEPGVNVTELNLALEKEAAR